MISQISYMSRIVIFSNHKIMGILFNMRLYVIFDLIPTFLDSKLQNF